MIWKPHLTVAAMVEHDGRFLVVEEHSEGRLVINQPAGHVEDGEAITDACIRETLEETGWRVTPDALVGIYRWVNPGTGDTMVRVCFACNGARQEAPRPLDDTIHAAHWLTEAQLRAACDRTRSPLVLRCLDDFLAGNRHPLALLQDVV
ncbi:MAG: NUDIX hydrolase [Pseudomonadota bacterium]|nr:NUDIX hydrolase [Pseudomonadota bacterium]